MNKLLCVCFPYGNNLEPSGIQIQAKQIGLSFLDRLCFYISPALACVFSIDQYLWIVKEYNRIKNA